jgi:hypothetical protein
MIAVVLVTPQNGRGDKAWQKGKRPAPERLAP